MRCYLRFQISCAHAGMLPYWTLLLLWWAPTRHRIDSGSLQFHPCDLRTHLPLYFIHLNRPTIWCRTHSFYIVTRIRVTYPHPTIFPARKIGESSVVIIGTSIRRSELPSAFMRPWLQCLPTTFVGGGIDCSFFTGLLLSESSSKRPFSH